MGSPVSNNTFRYVLEGSPIRRINSYDFTPEQWLILIKQELAGIRPLLRDMLGFRPLGEVIRLELETIVGMVAGYDGDARNDIVCRLMTMNTMGSPQASFMLLSRAGVWLHWKSMTRTADYPGGASKRADPVLINSLTDEDLLVLLGKSGSWLGIRMLRSIVEMVDYTIEEREKRLQALRVVRGTKIGQTLKRISRSSLL